MVAVAALAFAASGNAYSAPKTVLVVGDSLSAEYGLARGTGWVALLEQRLKAQKIDARIVNASISGETTSGGRPPCCSSTSRMSSYWNSVRTTACAACP
jgi:acyl-CoA thioesterase-1